MKIGVLKETNDRRVSLTPASVPKLTAQGFEIVVEQNAGSSAGFADAQYEEAGAKCMDRSSLLKQATILSSIHPLSSAELDQLQAGTSLIALFEPFNDSEISESLKKRELIGYSMDMIPRTTLAQSMDVLSSMASIAGYQAVLLGAFQLPRYLPMMITAAGSIRPAMVLVQGAGVAGLQAIATAKRLGATVEAFDVRQAAKEEVQSLGAKFIEVEGAKDDSEAGGYAVAQSEDFLKRQRAKVQERAAKADIIITTALVRGRKSPILLPASSVAQMKTGSVVVDLAASGGGNCELTKNGETIEAHGVTIIGNSNLANEMPEDASTLFSNNLVNYLKLFVQDGQWAPDPENEIIKASRIA